VIGFSNSSVPLAVTNGMNFSIPFGTNNVQFLFSLPVDARLTGASAIFNNWGAFSISQTTTDIRPYIAIATPAAGTYNFTILQNSIVYPKVGYVYGNNPASTVLTAYTTDLDVLIPAGTPIAIVAGLISLGSTQQALQQYIYMSGSLIFQ